MRISIRLHFALQAFLCLPYFNTHAEPVSEILVTGTIIPDEKVFKNIPRQVISANDIAAHGAGTVVDLLRGLAGVNVTQQGGPGGLTFISLRGGDPNFTVVMIDGVKMDDPTNSRGGGFDFAGLDPLLIERIEIFFGSYSAVYGSDALGGVISVTTRGANATPTSTLELEAGTDDAWAGALSLAGPVADIIDASISAVVRNGNNAVPGDSLERQQVAFKLRPGANLESQVDWAVNLFASNTDLSSFPQASGGDQLAVIRTPEKKKSDQLGTFGNINWAPADHWQLSLSAAWTRYREQSDHPGIAPGVLSGVPPVTTSSHYERANTVLSNTVSILEPLTLGFGAELVREKGKIESLIDFGFPLAADFEKIRTTWSVFAEAALQAHRNINLVSSLRYDDAGNIQSTTLRLAVNMRIPQSNTSLWFIYGEGFKLPSLFALGHALTGNPDLDPERSKNIELKIQQAGFDDRIDVSLSLYHSKFRELVDFDSSLFLHVNRSSVTSRGVDMDIALKFNDSLRITGSVGYLHADTGDSMVKLEHRPQWKSSLGVAWIPMEKLSVNVHGIFNGSFFDNSIPTGLSRLQGFERVDANMQWKVSPKFDLKLLFDNILGSHYEESAGFSNPGRQLRFLVSTRL